MILNLFLNSNQDLSYLDLNLSNKMPSFLFFCWNLILSLSERYRSFESFGLNKSHIRLIIQELIFQELTDSLRSTKLFIGTRDY